MITANNPGNSTAKCDGCKGEKGAPLAAIVYLSAGQVDLVLCQECGRDLANAVGFFCVRDGSWSKLEPRKRRGQPATKTTPEVADMATPKNTTTNRPRRAGNKKKRARAEPT